ncbi:expressed unknown protein [Seminavis robusta]|uniref:Uncharacterized protein n=1 Tax=Seminavis robusta TaxID=568900 RepID=A0A9N8E5U3_9STRA|nr:expressed unknown protein [Seminavis robusta]|eukprot:Sro573_g168920.1 n/a (437) ;mRNA; r:4204-5514
MDAVQSMAITSGRAIKEESEDEDWDRIIGVAEPEQVLSSSSRCSTLRDDARESQRQQKMAATPKSKRSATQNQRNDKNKRPPAFKNIIVGASHKLKKAGKLYQERTGSSLWSKREKICLAWYLRGKCNSDCKKCQKKRGRERLRLADVRELEELLAPVTSPDGPIFGIKNPRSTGNMERSQEEDDDDNEEEETSDATDETESTDNDDGNKHIRFGSGEDDHEEEFLPLPLKKQAQAPYPPGLLVKICSYKKDGRISGITQGRIIEVGINLEDGGNRENLYKVQDLAGGNTQHFRADELILALGTLVHVRRTSGDEINVSRGALIVGSEHMPAVPLPQSLRYSIQLQDETRQVFHGILPSEVVVRPTEVERSTEKSHAGAHTHAHSRTSSTESVTEQSHLGRVATAGTSSVHNLKKRKRKSSHSHHRAHRKGKNGRR